MINNGKYLEQLVHLIEKSISPTAIVKHDVKMPNLTSRIGAEIQCDIVIIEGNPPRETITIVEVQDRNRPVEMNDFRGWKQKLIDVGAQHLICVSNHEYSAAIKEQVEQSGNTIRLIKIDSLRDLEGLPINLFDVKFKTNNLLITSYEKIILSNSKKPIKFDRHSKCFSFDMINTFSLDKLCYDSFKPDKSLPKGKDKLIFTSGANEKLYFHYPRKIIQTDLELIINWHREIKNLPVVKTLIYEQNEFGVLAWVIEIFHKVNGKIIDIKMPVVKSKTGDSYEISQLYIDIPLGSELEIAVKKKNS